MVLTKLGIYSGLTSLTPAGSPSALPALALRSNPKRALSVLENRLNACFQRSGAEPKTKRLFCLSLSRHHKKTLPCGVFFYALDFPRKEKAPPKQEGAFFCFGRRLRIRTADPLGVNEML